jgi:hypothetical protein
MSGLRRLRSALVVKPLWLQVVPRFAYVPKFRREPRIRSFLFSFFIRARRNIILLVLEGKVVGWAGVEEGAC